MSIAESALFQEKLSVVLMLYAKIRTSVASLAVTAEFADWTLTD